MDPDEQKKQITESKLSERYMFDVSNVLPTVGIRSFIQDTLKHYWQLLDHRYHILLLIRVLLAIVLGSIEIF
jgi:hypothetical protein